MSELNYFDKINGINISGILINSGVVCSFYFGIMINEDYIRQIKDIDKKNKKISEFNNEQLFYKKLGLPHNFKIELIECLPIDANYINVQLGNSFSFMKIEDVTHVEPTKQITDSNRLLRLKENFVSKIKEDEKYYKMNFWY